MSLSVAGDRKTAYICGFFAFVRFSVVAECRRLWPGLSSQLSSIPSGDGNYLAPDICGWWRWSRAVVCNRSCRAIRAYL